MNRFLEELSKPRRRGPRPATLHMGNTTTRTNRPTAYLPSVSHTNTSYVGSPKTCMCGCASVHYPLDPLLQLEVCTETSPSATHGRGRQRRTLEASSGASGTAAPCYARPHLPICLLVVQGPIMCKDQSRAHVRLFLLPSPKPQPEYLPIGPSPYYLGSVRKTSTAYCSSFAEVIDNCTAGLVN